ncbi:MAG: ABC transporter permease [Acholeplasmataceae bacterium]|nr:ABC transporter permease [Acholeplasmataceae bacterium]
MRLALQIAWRFLASAKRQTIIIVLGIAVGVSVQVFIGSLITGLQKSLVDSTIGSSSHITVVSEASDTYIDNYQITINNLELESDDISVISPVVNLGGILQKDTLKKEILFRGFDLIEANQIYGFDSKITEGELPTLLNEILLGKSLKNDLNLNVGDTIDIEILGNVRSLTVVGFFDFNVAVINSTWGIGTLATLQDIIGSTNDISAIEMQINDVFQAEVLAATLDQNLSNSNLKTENWMSQNQELLSGLQGQSTSSLMIQVFVIISVVLGISSVLAITVMQKSRQIGILKAMGIQDKDASRIFLFEGFLLGIFGAFAGVVLGLGLLYSFTTFALNPDGSPVVPLFIDPQFIALSALIALVASTFASLIPAIKSSKMTVIEVIRNA